MELDDLVRRVRGDDPLARLGSAVGVKADLDDLSDRLIGHFVAEARAAGHSWSEIGGAMGVTKQAAQQRHSAERPPKRSGRMFTRCSDRARQAVERSSTVAEELGHAEVGVVHLVLGVLDVRDSLGSVVLDALGVDRAAVLGAAGDVPARSGRRTSLSRSAKKVVELALREALAMHRNHIGTEHLLLAALREQPALLPGVTRERLLDAIAEHEVAA